MVAPSAAVTVMSAGTVIAGGVVSTTVTVNDAVDVLPATSLAEQLTVVVPSPKTAPDAGVQLSVTTPG